MTKRYRVKIIILFILVIATAFPVTKTNGMTAMDTEIDAKSLYERQRRATSSTQRSWQPNIATITIGQTSSPITMEYTYGYNSYGKYGRQIPVFAKLKNKTKHKFSGWLEVAIPLVENVKVYRKQVIIDPGETTAISMTIPLSGGYGQLDVKLLDDKGDIILERTNEVRVGNFEKIIYGGILSDKPEDLRYIDNLSINTFHFDHETFPEETSYLDMLDVIIINNFDTSLLNSDQIKAIKQWVQQGGSLVIGTGQYGSKVLASLAEELDINKADQVTSSSITSHIDKAYIERLKSYLIQIEEERNLLRSQIIEHNKILEGSDNPLIYIDDISTDSWPSEYIEDYDEINVVKDLANVSFIDGEGSDSRGDIRSFSIINENRQEIDLYQKKDIGRGNIILYTFDLGLNEDILEDLEPSESNLYQTSLIFSISNNLSSSKQRQIQDELSPSSIPYSIINSMSYTDTSNIPNVIIYVIIILIYVILISPILYFVLSRKDKRGSVWIILPILAVVFTFIMYIAGSKTRVDDPFVGYVEIRTFTDDNLVEDELYFSLTAPYNDNYTLMLAPHYDSINLIDEGNEFPTYNLHQPHRSDNKYMAAVNYGINSTILEVNNNPAFTPVFFEASNEYIGNNPIEANISYTGDKIEGTISNKSNYTILNAIYIGDGFLFNIGTMYHGQTIDIEDIEKLYVYDNSDVYSSDIVEKVIYGDELPSDGQYKPDAIYNRENTGDTGDKNRKKDIIYYLIDKHFEVAPEESCIIGFASDEKVTRFIEEVSREYQTYGSQAIVSHVNVDYSKGEAEFIPSISPFVVRDEMRDFGVRPDRVADAYPEILTEEETIIEYYLPKDEEVLSIEYYAFSNPEPLNENNRPFVGRIYGLNRKTGEFEHLFTANASKNEDTTLITGDKLRDYIKDDNVLTLKYKGIISQMDAYMLLPNISYWKEGE